MYSFMYKHFAYNGTAGHAIYKAWYRIALFFETVFDKDENDV